MNGDRYVIIIDEKFEPPISLEIIFVIQDKNLVQVTLMTNKLIPLLGVPLLLLCIYTVFYLFLH
ncbi:MAG: hypothetical protein ACI8RD_006311 [Bacillariaceae sp.]|jgi:hypothetical protein